LSASFDDPSATIVYPYVYRILNSSAGRAAKESQPPEADDNDSHPSPTSSRPTSPQTRSSSSLQHPISNPRSSSPTPSNNEHLPSPIIPEPDPDSQLLTIIGHISSETTGALHKEGITELHQFLKAYPHKRVKVEKLLESTGPAFRKYINRALATRAAEDQEREVAVADTLSSKLLD
jgi:cytoskeleton-associated protein 5